MANRLDGYPLYPAYEKDSALQQHLWELPFHQLLVGLRW